MFIRFGRTNREISEQSWLSISALAIEILANQVGRLPVCRGKRCDEFRHARLKRSRLLYTKPLCRESGSKTVAERQIVAKQWGPLEQLPAEYEGL
jgi:hypothetical protein